MIQNENVFMKMVKSFGKTLLKKKALAKNSDKYWGIQTYKSNKNLYKTLKIGSHKLNLTIDIS